MNHPLFHNWASKQEGLFVQPSATSRSRVISHAVYALIFFGLVEAIWGTLQLSGILPSRHSHYALTGSFYNPGPYGCFIGSVLPVAVWIFILISNRIVKLMSGGYILLAALLLPAAMSRTGIIAAAIGSAIVFIGLYKSKIKQLTTKQFVFGLCFGIIAVTAGCVSAYLIKPESAQGRLLIWKIAWKAAKEVPFPGVGWENVAGTYGSAQESFFLNEPHTPTEEMLADAPPYVFNEYLQLAIAFGMAAALLFGVALAVLAFIFWRKRQYGLSGMTFAFILVCAASYPLQFWEFKLTIGAVVLLAMLSIHSKFARYLSVSFWVVFWGGICISAKPADNRTLFNEAKQANRTGQYEASNSLLRELIPHTSDPMPLNLMGKNYQALAMPDSAELWFNRAAVRVPNRLYPHYLLMKLFAETGDTLRMIEQAHILLTKQPKTHSLAIEEMRSEASALLEATFN